MKRFTIRKRRFKKPLDRLSPYWVWDNRHREYTVGFTTFGDAYEQALDWNREEKRKAARVAEYSTAPERQEAAVVRRSRFQLIHGGAA